MKTSTVFTAALVTVVCLFQSAASETEALTQLRVNVDTNGAICYKSCPTGQYCPRGESACRAPTGDLCFNPASSLFQHGCGVSFKCSYGKCVYKSPPSTSSGAICYKACPTGQYCPRGETECRAPIGDLCFNPATSVFQHGCDLGFKCSNGKCVYKTTVATTESSAVESTQLRSQSPNGAFCYENCPHGQYCPRGETKCRAPTGTQCFNPATSLFQAAGCARGFHCSYGKCVYDQD
ncbi:hypothetical protein PRIC1_006948 [Phytophthora ramorum]